MSDDTTRRLEEAGTRPVPPPDDAFADALEQRLLAVAASLPPAEPGTPPPGRQRVPGLRWRLVGSGLVAAVTVVALAFALSRPAPVVTQELAQPVNVAVTLADGTRLEDPDGMLLPEGAVIEVGAGGYARIGSTVLQPGDIAVVEHGGLRVEHQGSTGSVTTTPAPSARPTATRTPGPTNRPTPTPAPTPARTPARTPAPTVAPTPAPTPARTEAPTPTPLVTLAPAASATPTPTATPTPILRPRLRARLIEPAPDGTQRIALRWTETYRARSYVLLVTGAASGPAPDPVYGFSRVVGTFARPPELALRFRVPAWMHEVKFRVIALRADGSVLRRSNIVTITVPGGDASGSSQDPGPAASPSPSPTPTPTPTPTPGP